MSETIDSYQRKRLVDVIADEIVHERVQAANGDGLSPRSLAERVTDRLWTERHMAVYALGGIDRDHAMEYWTEQHERASEARAERDRAREALENIRAAGCANSRAIHREVLWGLGEAGAEESWRKATAEQEAGW